MSLEIAQAMVRDFHRTMEVSRRVTPGFHHEWLRRDLIAEEARETLDAIKHGDFPEAIDGLCDLIYVCLGAADVWGVDLSPIFAEVHRANMAKVGATRREDGKIEKPADWTPPDIYGQLKAQGWNGGTAD